jgi:hypothetical protein
MAVMCQVEVFSVVTPCGVAVGYYAASIFRVKWGTQWSISCITSMNILMITNDRFK